MKKFILYIAFIVCTLSTKAQDPQFTQFYAAPMYLNPAFVGNTIQDRVIMNYRYQWPSIPQAFVSYNLSYDHNLADIRSGVGFHVSHDKAGTGGLKYTNVAALYAYSFKLSRKWVLKPGLAYSFTWRNLDFSKLTFGDQLIRGGVGGTVEQFQIQNLRYFDFSAGTLAYSEKLWFGYSWHHINQPNQSLIGSEAPLPYKMSLHGGGRISFNSNRINAPDHVLIPAFNYKLQGDFDQFDIGFYYEHDPIVIGLWYRGIPGLKAYQPGYQNNDAVAILFGYEIGDLKIGYSYDLTISRLISNTAGTHELSIVFEWANPETKLSRIKRNIPCPKF